jgi:hypothetical protein
MKHCIFSKGVLNPPSFYTVGQYRCVHYEKEQVINIIDNTNFKFTIKETLIKKEIKNYE